MIGYMAKLGHGNSASSPGPRKHLARSSRIPSEPPAKQSESPPTPRCVASASRSAKQVSSG
jgi:hypothetical protein